MLDSSEIIQGVEHCKSLIKNWDIMENIDLDFMDVQIDGLLVDKQPDDKDEKWEISLLTTIYSHYNNNGRDVYSVRWGFRDLWGNIASFSLNGHILAGALYLNYINYDDFAIVGFSIVKPDGTPIFRFDEPDEVSIVSINKIGHQTLQDIYPNDYEPHNGNL